MARKNLLNVKCRSTSLSSVKFKSSGFADFSRKITSAFDDNKDALCI